MKYSHRHVRVPRESGRLAAPGGGPAGRAAATERASQDADVVIVNTCSVTATADQGARQTIRRVARENPARAHRRDRLLRDALRGRGRRAAGCGPRRAQRREVRLHRWTRGPARAVDTRRTIGTVTDRAARRSSPGVAGRTAFTLRVQTGCEERCTYCIIPSRAARRAACPSATWSREVERVAAAGFKEIALTGVHLGSYGRDLSPPVVAARAAARARRASPATSRSGSARSSRWTARRRSSISSRHSGRFEPHFHLPLQHASDRMLRGDAAARIRLDYYRRLVDRIDDTPAARVDRDRT